MTTGRRGFSLLAVMWLVALLGAAALRWSSSIRPGALALGNQVRRSQTRAAAESGLAVARATMDHRLTPGRDLPDAPPDPWLMESPLLLSGPATPGSDLQWHARVSDLGAKLNLNSVQPRQLRRLLVWARLDARSAARIADATADWIDGDDAVRVDGAELEQYRELGQAVLPTNEPFSHVDEWSHVLGVTPELVASLSDVLTVRGSGRVNLKSAPESVLLSLPGFLPETVELLRSPAVTDFETLADGLSPNGRSLLRDNLAWLGSRTTFTTEELEISTQGLTADGRFSTTLTAVVVRSGSASTVVSVAER